MTQQIRRTETSGNVKALSVADYVVERLAAEGITDSAEVPLASNQIKECCGAGCRTGL
jgi:hypothetical protein